MRVFPVLTSEVGSHWRLAEAFLIPAIENSHGRWMPEDVLDELKAGGSQLWLVIDGALVYGAAVTKIGQYPRLKVLDFAWLGGVDAERWLGDLDREVGAWAAKQNCERLEMTARKGWERMGSPYGFVPRFVVFERLIGEEDRYGPREDDRTVEGSDNHRSA